MITASKRMLTEETSQANNHTAQTNSNIRYETIVIGDAFCGKSTYLNNLADMELNLNLPVMISQNKSEFEFWIEHNNRKAIFTVKDTASIFQI